MATPISDSPLAILTFIAAPAVFTNAASVLALGTGNRLARVVDRTRQLGRLGRRSDRLVRAMTFFYTAVGAFAAASLVAVVGASLGTTHYQLPFEVVAFFSLAAGGIGFVGLALGSGFLVQETRLAVVSHQEEAAAAMALAAPKSS